MSDAADDPDDGPPRDGRGFFGRLLGALSPAEDEPEGASSRGRGGHGLGALRTTRVEDVAVPKSDVVAVPVSIPFEGLVAAFRESGRTRLPVHEGSLDAPLGLVNLKDLALRHGFGAPPEGFDLRAMLRPLLYVPPSMPLAALLQRMQAERIHMALVIDEYGGTDGLVTLEDLLETVVGEIADEHDIEEPQSFSREAEGVWVADGATDLREFERATGVDLTAHEDLDAEEADTLGGLAFLLSGHVPQTGEIISHPDGPVIEVLDADARRVRRLRLRLNGA